MKSSYEARAMKFATTLVSLFKNCINLDDFEWAIKYYNMTHSRKLRYAHGVSRIAIIRADYVIKFNIKPEGSFDDGCAGNCESERAVYERACEDGFEYLLAKTTIYVIKGRTIAIMPRINNISNYSRKWWQYCTEEEAEWLGNNVYDLHEGNVGYRNGKVCVVDYAWDAGEN